MKNDVVYVFSEKKDGAERRRHKRIAPRYVIAPEKASQEGINEALRGVDQHVYLGLGDAWDRIFGGDA